MPMRYFDLADDISLLGRWELGQPLDQNDHQLEDPWQFRVGEPVRFQGHLQIPVKRPGTPLDFSHAAFSIPVVHVRVASLFKELAPGDVQTLPVDIQGQPNSFCILVATRLIQCIDDKASEEVEHLDAGRWTTREGRAVSRRVRHAHRPLESR